MIYTETATCQTCKGHGTVEEYGRWGLNEVSCDDCEGDGWVHCGAEEEGEE